MYSPVVGETVGLQVYRKSIGGLDAVRDACAELSQDIIYLDLVVASQRRRFIAAFFAKVWWFHRDRSVGRPVMSWDRIRLDCVRLASPGPRLGRILSSTFAEPKSASVERARECPSGRAARRAGGRDSARAHPSPVRLRPRQNSEMRTIPATIRAAPPSRDAPARTRFMPTQPK